MKGNSNCHIFTEQGRDNYDSIFGKKEIKELATSGKRGSKAGTKLKGQFQSTDSTVLPFIKKVHKKKVCLECGMEVMYSIQHNRIIGCDSRCRNQGKVLTKMFTTEDGEEVYTQIKGDK